MNKREGAIIGAYTGVLCGEFGDLHEYIEEIMGRSVWTHELGSKTISKEIKDKSKADFVVLAESIN